MRFRVRKFAHFFERIGLAMAGAACGLFVSAHVGSTISTLTSQGFLLVMMVIGAIGFYLGIDTPQLAFHGDDDPTIDAAEFLSAVGTLCDADRVLLGRYHHRARRARLALDL